MLKVLKKWRNKSTEDEELLKNKIYLIALFVFVWAASCMYIVGSHYENMLLLNIPVPLDIQPIIDGLWFMAYVAILIGLQLTAIHGINDKKAKFIIGAVITAGISQVLMYVSFFIFLFLVPALVLNIVNVVAIWSVVFVIWKFSKIGSLLTMIYGLMSGYSVYLIIRILLSN